MKKKATGYDYGECEICNTPMKEEFIKQDFWIRGKLIIVGDVPAGVCPKYGEKVVKADVGHSILRLIEISERIARAPKILFLRLNSLQRKRDIRRPILLHYQYNL